MRIVSWNVNGLRAAHRKEELAKFIKKQDADILLLQETKGKAKQFEKISEEFPQYDTYYQEAEKAGYSGVATWVKKDLGKHVVAVGMDGWNDVEGRVLRLDMNGYTIFNIYFPNGGKSPEAWEEKLVFYEHVLKRINTLRKQGRNIIFAGDVNCAHQEIDLARPKDNDGKVGFHPKERAWMDKVIRNEWVDVFRDKHPNTVIYSWWHVLSGARKRNVGWRIDYFFLDKPLLKKVKQVFYDNDQLGSDHCPVVLEIAL